MLIIILMPVSIYVFIGNGYARNILRGIPA